jgi:thiol-disulfide isomerase/thioredoxin
MKRRVYIVLTACLLLPAIQILSAQGFRLSVTLPDLPGQEIILSHRLGMKFYTDDTVKTDALGRALFLKDELMPRGMYQLVFPDKKFVEFFIDVKQKFELYTRIPAASDSIRFKGSPENSKFAKWQQEFSRNRDRSGQVQARLKKGNLSTDSTRILNDELRQIQQSTNTMWEKYTADLAGTLPGKFINGLKPVKIPESEGKPDTAEKQLKQYRYVREHFFDGVDFTDQALLRTPLIETKLDQFFNQVLQQNADTLITEAVHLIERTRSSKEMYQFVGQYLFNLYSSPKVMGTDAVYVYLADTYYLNGQTPWVDSANLRGIRSRAAELRPLLLGKVAPELTGLISDKDQPVDINKITANYLILYFWSPDCGFCKETTPKFAAMYQELKESGIEILALNTRLEKEDWLKFIADHQLGWINAYCPSNVRHMIEQYQAFATPAIYILDRSRRIIAKSISWEQVKPFMKQYIEIQAGR